MCDRRSGKDIEALQEKGRTCSGRWVTVVGVSHRLSYLHPDYSIDEEQHGYQECNVGKSLGGEKRYKNSRGITWKDLMKVHSRVLMPSPLLRSLTSRITLNRRKKVMEMRALSSVFWGVEERESDRGRREEHPNTALCHSFLHAVSHAFL
ncbi:hypothetical protein EYF80_035374 [Liparis tanakae]|uniref:Uncharacterized protein n=1 Tax=Liparis tanakae TaxID=230148 RepID=A0A4Z2GMG8_9TELE|nr:hypothetical protein EYF80_035374 [Liparis tanakae]